MSLPAGVKAQLDAMFQHLFAECEALIRREVPKQFGQIFRGGKIDGPHVTVAYPATGSPGATAPANSGKLGAMYPDGTTIQMTVDGQISTTSADGLAQAVSETASTKTLNLWNGSSNNAPPASWETSGFNDSAWVHPITGGAYPATQSIPPGSTAVWPTVPAQSPTQSALFRRSFTLPAGAVHAAALSFSVDSIGTTGVINHLYLNGTALSFTPIANNQLTYNTVTIDPGLLVAGGVNVIAAQASNTALSGMWLAFTIQVHYIPPGNIVGETIQHNGTFVDTQPALDFEDPGFTIADDSANSRVKVSLATFGASGGGHKAGIVPDPGSSTGSAKFLREDASWQVPGSGLSNPMTTTGDMIYSADNSGTPARVGIGSAGKVLGVAGGLPAWLPVSGVGLTTTSAYLGADVTMTTSGTIYDAVSLSLAAGTWLIFGTAVIHGAGTNDQAVVMIRDGGGTVYSSGNAFIAVTGGELSVAVAALVAPGSTTTYKLSAVADDNNDKIKAAITNNGQGNTSTYLLALKVG